MVYNTGTSADNLTKWLLKSHSSSCKADASEPQIDNHMSSSIPAQELHSLERLTHTPLEVHHILVNLITSSLEFLRLKDKIGFSVKEASVLQFSFEYLSPDDPFYFIFLP